MNPFYFLTTLLTVIVICPVEAATLVDSAPHLEVFTTREHKIRLESHAEAMYPDQSIDLQVYLLEGIQQFESVLSKELPTDFKQAKQIALQRFQHLDEEIMETMQQATLCLSKAMQYGLDRYPAIVFDGKAVVLGMPDLESALELYRQWLSESQP